MARRYVVCVLETSAALCIRVICLTGLIVWAVSPVLAISESGSVNISAFVAQTAAAATIDSSSGGSTTLTTANNTTVVFNFPSNFYTEDVRLQANSYASDFFSSFSSRYLKARDVCKKLEFG